jgi:hypothetical protein
MIDISSLLGGTLATRVARLNGVKPQYWKQFLPADHLNLAPLSRRYCSKFHSAQTIRNAT